MIHETRSEQFLPLLARTTPAETDTLNFTQLKKGGIK